MGIDNIEELKPPPYVNLHDPARCGGQGICLTCSTEALQEVTER